MTNIFYVYQLRLETSEEPFYIGKGCKNRVNEHFRPSSLKSNSIKNNIIKKAQLNNIKIIAEKLHENLEEMFSLDLEINYISMYGKICDNTGILSNLSDGGETSIGYKHSPEIRQKLSERAKNRTHTPPPPQTGKNNYFAKNYEITTPNGDIIIIKCLKDFRISHNMCKQLIKDYMNKGVIPKLTFERQYRIKRMDQKINTFGYSFRSL